MTDARQKVLAGALFLTFIRTDKWWDKIDPDTLNVDDVHNCPLGQLYGSYDKGVTTLELEREHAHDLGFYISAENCDYDFDRLSNAYSALSREWASLIKELREVAASAE